MADSNSYILRSDDGQLYRVTKDQLAAYKVAAGDPATHEAPKLAKMHETAKKAVAQVSADLICFLAMRESSGPPKK
jgi:hypothetical protein